MRVCFTVNVMQYQPASCSQCFINGDNRTFTLTVLYSDHTGWTSVEDVNENFIL